MIKKSTGLILVILLISTLTMIFGCSETEEVTLEGSYESPYLTMDYPGDWTVQDENLEIIQITNFISPSEEKMIGISMSPISGGLTEEDIYRMWEEEIEEEQARGDFLFHEEREIEGKTAHVVHFNSLPGETTYRVLTVHEDYIFSMDARIPTDDFDDFKRIPDAMVNSISFHERTN